MIKKRLLVFASGTKDGGGSGLRKMLEYGLPIVGVVSNHENGGVKKIADEYDIPFTYFPISMESLENFQKVVRHYKADFVMLSGYMRFAIGLDPKTSCNIHPAPLPEFGGVGMYGRKAHEAVLAAYKREEITHSAVSIHFVVDGNGKKEDGYDKGPLIFSLPIKIFPDDTVDDLAARVNAAEHKWQSKIMEMVINGEIYWDGVDPNSVVGAMILKAA